MKRVGWLTCLFKGLLMSLLLAGCASSPHPDFYLLSADATVAPSPSQLQLGIARISVAAYLDRPQIVALDQGNRLQINEYHRWAEPLDDGVRRVLTLNLAALLGTEHVRSMPWPRSELPDWVVRCDVERLDVGPGRIDLVAAWRVEHSGSGTLELSRISRISVARSGSGPDSVATDASAALLQLSEQIASAIGGLSAGAATASH